MEGKEVTIEEMAGMLSDNSPEPPAEPKKEDAPPAVEPKESAAPAEEQPASQPAEAGDENKPSESGTGNKEQKSQEPQEKTEKGKFAPKEGKETPESVQKRINKAIWEKHEADRKREAAEREAAELRKKLEQQASGKPASDKESSEKPATSFPEQKPKRPVEDDFESLTDYNEAMAQYTEDISAWTVRKDRYETELASRTEAARQKEAEASKQWYDRVAKRAEKNPAINEALNNVGPFLTEAGQADFIMQSEVGLEIVDYLHNHAAEAIELAKSGDVVKVARAIGRIEAEILSSRKAPPPRKPEPSLDDDLPDPPAVVGGRATPSTGVDLSDEKTSMEDWSREFKRQLEAAS